MRTIKPEEGSIMKTDNPFLRVESSYFTLSRVYFIGMKNALNVILRIVHKSMID